MPTKKTVPTSQRSIVISNIGQKKTLSKAQQTFNRLVKSIERKQKELLLTKTNLDNQMKFYAETLHPLETATLQTQKQLIETLFDIFSDKKIALKQERKKLRETIQFHLDDYLEKEGVPDEKIETIFKQLFGLSIDEDTKEQEKVHFKNIKASMQSVFEANGMDIDLEGFNVDMTPEEMFAYMKKLEEDIFQKGEEKPKRAAKKKSKTQLKKEENQRLAEEAKSKSIGTVYKQLAKIFHPDLEKDDSARKEKEELMKQLTSAYANNDLHTLLRLELQWIQKEDNNTDALTDEKLAVYNTILKEQVNDLEMEIHAQYGHPQYQVLHQYAINPLFLSTLDLKHEAKRTTDQNKRMQNMLRALGGDDEQKIQSVKKINNDVRKIQSEVDLIQNIQSMMDSCF